MLNTKKILSFITAVLILVMCHPPAAAAAAAKERYLSADACYRKLLKSPKRMKYRDNWLQCIRKFEAVYRHDPSGSWAAAGLYMSGKLYRGLYQYSYLESDKKEALDIFRRVVKRYPKSRYRQRAATEIAALSGSPGPGAAKVSKKTLKGTPKKSTKVSGKAVSARSDAAGKQFRDAESCYDTLNKSAQKKKYRDNWLRCIGKFDAVHKKDPSGPRAAAGLYMAGKLFEELHRISYRKSDKLAAFDRYDRTLSRYPDSKYGEKAAESMGVKAKKSEPSPPAKRSPPAPALTEEAGDDAIGAVIEKSYMTPQAEKKPAEATPGGHATVQGLRYWSNPSYTRIVIDADRKTQFTHRLLKKDPSIKKPQRLYVDLMHSRLGSGIPKTIPINDNLLSDARAGQHTADEVRVVVDINSFRTYKIFSLRNPFRIVIDVWGKTQTRLTGPTVSPDIARKNGKGPPANLARQLSLGVSRIVIDPGHGGKDFGAPGYLKGVHEKKIALAIAKKLAKKIRKKLGAEVIMTRSGDQYLTLEERTALANTKNADLFISIHTNSARNREAYGIETFFLNLATDDDAILVAARENATSKKNISDLQTILSDLMQNAKINESSRLAGIMQKTLYSHMKKRYSKIKSKGVKQAPFYVLLGAQMPAVLIETSFISNPRECRRLVDKKYQDQLCEGIVEGIRRYIREINPSALAAPPLANRPVG